MIDEQVTVVLKDNRVEVNLDVDDMTVVFRLTPGEARLLAGMLMGAANKHQWPNPSEGIRTDRAS